MQPQPVPPERQLPEVITVEAMRLIDVRHRTLGSKIESVLSDRSAAAGAAKTRSVVENLGVGVTAANGKPSLQPATQLNAADVCDGVRVRRFPRERLNVDNS